MIKMNIGNKQFRQAINEAINAEEWAQDVLRADLKAGEISNDYFTVEVIDKNRQHIASAVFAQNIECSAFYKVSDWYR